MLFCKINSSGEIYASHYAHYLDFLHFYGARVSECLHVQQRITIPEIRNHEWFLKNLPADLMDENMMGNQFQESDQPSQSLDTIMQIIAEATIPAVGAHGLNSCMTDYLDMDDDMDDLESDSELDVDSSGEVVYAI